VLAFFFAMFALMAAALLVGVSRCDGGGSCALRGAVRLEDTVVEARYRVIEHQIERRPAALAH